jgi:raffinose/stachyose/melibiose transport system substrate-binding protein
VSLPGDPAEQEGFVMRDRARSVFLVGVIVVVCSALATGAATAGTSGSSAARATTVKMLVSTGVRVAFDAIIKNYELAHPSVDIQPTYVSNTQLGPLLATQLAAGNAPDVIYAQTGSGVLNGVIPLARAGHLASLDNRPWVKRVSPAAKPFVTVGSKIYARPTDDNVVGIAYDKPMFAQMGLQQPKTFAQLLSMCRQVAGVGKSLFVLGARSDGLPSFAGLIGSVFGEPPSWYPKRAKGTVSFASSKAWRSALQHVVAMKNAGCFQAHPESMSQSGAFAAFAAGQAPFLVAIPPNIASAKKLNPDLDAGMFPFPGDSPASTRMLANWGSSLTVWAKSPVLQTAIDIVDFFARQGQSELLSKVNGTVSPRDWKLGILPPTLSSFTSLYKSKRVVPIFKNSLVNEQTNQAFIQGITGLFTGQKNVDQILHDMDKAWEQGSAA